MTNKYYEIAYKLYTIFEGNKELEEEAPESDPFRFISGFGTTIPGFEAEIEKLNDGDEFDFTLKKENAYGDYYEERIVTLDKQIFSIDGKFDSNNVFVDAIIPLQNADGNRFMGRVMEITDKEVRIDLNHPLAGRDLNFVGKVTMCREASNEEIQAMFNHMNGGCGGGCGGCGGGGCHGGDGNCGGDCNCGGEGNCDGDCNCK